MTNREHLMLHPEMLSANLTRLCCADNDGVCQGDCHVCGEIWLNKEIKKPFSQSDVVKLGKIKRILEME